MPDRLSKSQIDKLGERLRTSDEVSVEDLTVLQQVRSEHDAAMAVVADRLTTELGLEPGSRLKTVGTIVDKLRREHIRLSQMQDIAGVRVIKPMTLNEQDELVAAVTALFPGARTVDRRAQPTHGYRAVHVVVSFEGRGVEIQVRTELQHVWAQVFERMADVLGRGIRYGEPPDPRLPEALTDPLRRVLQEFSEVTAKIEALETEVNDETHKERVAVMKADMLDQMRRLLLTLSVGESGP